MKVMVKVIYAYLAVIFGGALIAVFYLRAQDRGWPSTITFISMLVAVTVFQVRRQSRRRAEADGASDEDA